MIETMTKREMKLYMFQLLIALAYLDELGVMHRDVKPSNFLWDRKSKRGTLVDFGLAEIVCP